jgi:hypothetical protein
VSRAAEVRCCCHRLLLEYGSNFDGAGALGLGYNVTLDATWQLISAVQIGLPSAGEPAPADLVFGVIVTLPGPSAPERGRAPR